MAVNGFLKASGTPRRTFSTSVVGSRGGDLFAGLRVDAWPAMAASGIDSHRTPSVQRVVVIDWDLRGLSRSFRRNVLPDPDFHLLCLRVRRGHHFRWKELVHHRRYQ